MGGRQELASGWSSSEEGCDVHGSNEPLLPAAHTKFRHTRVTLAALQVLGQHKFDVITGRLAIGLCFNSFKNRCGPGPIFCPDFPSGNLGRQLLRSFWLFKVAKAAVAVAGGTPTFAFIDNCLPFDSRLLQLRSQNGKAPCF